MPFNLKVKGHFFQKTAGVSVRLKSVHRPDTTGAGVGTEAAGDTFFII
jgi:hypothetical protein